MTNVMVPLRLVIRWWCGGGGGVVVVVEVGVFLRFQEVD